MAEGGATVNLHLHVKTEYFNAIKSGEKKKEYRLANEYWWKRLIGREYDGIVIYNAYRPGADNRIHMPYFGWVLETITHQHFGPNPVRVFAIQMTVQP